MVNLNIFSNNKYKRANLTLSPTFRIITDCVVTGLRYKFWLYNMNIYYLGKSMT